MLLSLLVYSLTGATLFFLGWHVNRREQRLQLQSGGELPFYSWEIILSLLIFAVVAGARYHTGFDHKMYLDQYLHLQQTGEFGRDNFFILRSVIASTCCAGWGLASCAVLISCG